MRIAHITQWYNPATGYQENHLPYQQGQLGHEIHIITSTHLRPAKNGQEPVSFPLGSQEEREVKIERLKGVWVSKARAQIYLRQLNRILASLNPDVVHAHGLWTTPSLELLLHKKPDYRLFVDDHVDDDNLALHRWQTRLRVTIFKLVFLPQLEKRVVKFISVNPFSKQFLINEFNLPKDKVELLPLGIDIDTYYPKPSFRQEYRIRLKLAPNDILVVTSGNIGPTKGVDLLIRAVGKLNRTIDNLKLLIVGRGSREYMSYLKRLMSEQGLSEDKVKFHNWVTQQELCKIYNAADVAVMPKKLGGIKEALGVGLPLIVAEHPATSYFVKNGNGATFERDNPHALEAALGKYVVDPELRKHHGQLSLDFVNSELSWKRIATRSIEIYNQTA